MYRGKQKKLENLAQRKPSNTYTSKPGFLQQHSSKIEQKLNHLKDQILEKRKISTNDKKNHQINIELCSFMTKIGMSEYLSKFQENGIDSLQILKQIKQSELEEIGITKGHALKIVVNVKKQEEKSRKKIISQQKLQSQSTLDQSTIKCNIEKKQKPIAATQISDLQTDSIPLEKIKKQFCLYCFSRSQHMFCTNKCQSLYNSMFQRYQSNLEKAEENFMPKIQQTNQKQEELSDNQQFLQDFDFLFNPQLPDFDEKEYQMVKEIIKK